MTPPEVVLIGDYAAASMRRQEAVVWIAPFDEKNEGDVLGAANAAAARLELSIAETFRGIGSAADAIEAARRVGTLIIPTAEPCVATSSEVADLIQSAEREGWRLLLLDLGADSAAPSGTLLTQRLRSVAALAGSVDLLPIPPSHLLRRVGGGAEHFRVAGFMDTRSYLDAFLDAGGSIGKPDLAVLDWGAGCGRMTSHLAAALPSARVTAVDIDPEALAWLRSNIRVADALETAIDPPLPFPDHSFDLIIGHSVFTHLDSDAQDAWLAELARVVRSDGVVVVCTHGEAALRWHAEHPLVAFPGAIAAAMSSLGFFFWRGEGWEAEYHDGYHTTFHEPWYIRDHWSRWFEFVDVKPSAIRKRLDLVVLKKRR